MNTVTGTYVNDAEHGWTEIHPAWIVNGKGTACYTAAAVAKSVKTEINGNKAYFGGKGSSESDDRRET